MIVWVLWEDQRGGGASRKFGPHELLLSCVSDDHGSEFSLWVLQERVQANPRKSNSKVLSALQGNLKQFLDDGPLCVVFDRDKAHRMWGASKEPARCRTALLEKIKTTAPGAYEVILLEENVETLFSACCRVLGRDTSSSKPNPGERDEILRKLAYQPNPELRRKVRAEVGSFDRLVRKVGELVAGF